MPLTSEPLRGDAPSGMTSAYMPNEMKYRLVVERVVALSSQMTQLPESSPRYGPSPASLGEREKLEEKTGRRTKDGAESGSCV
jgi:hypothetical protein